MRAGLLASPRQHDHHPPRGAGHQRARHASSQPPRTTPRGLELPHLPRRRGQHHRHRPLHLRMGRPAAPMGADEHSRPGRRHRRPSPQQRPSPRRRLDGRRPRRQLAPPLRVRPPDPRRLHQPATWHEPFSRLSASPTPQPTGSPPPKPSPSGPTHSSLMPSSAPGSTASPGPRSTPSPHAAPATPATGGPRSSNGSRQPASCRHRRAADHRRHRRPPRLPGRAHDALSSQRRPCEEQPLHGSAHDHQHEQHDSMQDDNGEGCFRHRRGGWAPFGRRPLRGHCARTLFTRGQGVKGSR